MICKRCNNQMVWVGQFSSGHLTCEHCDNDDDVLKARVDLTPYLADIKASAKSPNFKVVECGHCFGTGYNYNSQGVAGNGCCDVCKGAGTIVVQASDGSMVGAYI